MRTKLIVFALSLLLCRAALASAAQVEVYLVPMETFRTMPYEVFTDWPPCTTWPCKTPPLRLRPTPRRTAAWS